MVKAIILAGGRSSRMPGETLKQYRRVNNEKMLVTYSIEAFIRSSKVDSITVVVDDEAWQDGEGHRQYILMTAQEIVLSFLI